MKEKLTERKREGPKRRFSVMWRHMLLMTVLLLLSVTVMSLHYRISLDTLTKEKLEKTQISLDRDCSAFSEEAWLPYAIPDAIERTRYYDYIRAERAGVLPEKYYSVMMLISDALSNQVYLQRLSAESVLYFSGCNAVATTQRPWYDAVDCFQNGIVYETMDEQVVLGHLRSHNSLTIFPLQRVNVNGQTKEVLTVIIRPAGSGNCIMSLYTRDTVLSALGYDYLPEGTYLKLETQEGQTLMEYPEAFPDAHQEDYLTLTAPVGSLKAQVTVQISKAAFAQQLRPVQAVGMGLIAFVTVLGLVLSVILSRISVEPIRRLVSTHEEGEQNSGGDELVSLSRILNASRERSAGLRDMLVASQISKLYSGAVLSQSDEDFLRKTALPKDQEYRLALIQTDPRVTVLLGPALEGALEGCLWVALGPSQTALVMDGQEKTLAALTQLLDGMNQQLEGDEHGIQCGVSTPVRELSSFPLAVRQAKLAMPVEKGITLYRGGGDRVHLYARLQHERLYQSIFENNEEEALRMITHLTGQLTAENVREVFYNVRFTLRSAAEEMELDTSIFDVEYDVTKIPRRNMEKLIEMLQDMFRQLRSRSEGTVTDKQETMMAWIREHACDLTICASAVAEEFSISQKRVYETVRTMSGMTLNEYLVSIRMKKAGRLLYATQLSISEIGEQCGYPAASTFYRIFRNYHGVTPNQYRQNGALPENE